MKAVIYICFVQKVVISVQPAAFYQFMYGPKITFLAISILLRDPDVADYRKPSIRPHKDLPAVKE